MSQEKVPFYYTNNMNVTMSTFDFRVDIGRITESGTELQAQVSMSPQHFKALVGVLNQNLANYESLYGPIILEPNTDAIKKLQEEGIVTQEINHEIRKS
jgi:hypothetical protein